MASVAGLYYYPVKSCRAVSLNEATVDSFGFENDRRFMFVRGNGRFLSQRQEPRLATIKATITTTGRRIDRLRIESSLVENALEIRPRFDGETIDVSVWEDRVRGVDQGVEAAEWLRGILRTDSVHNRLVAVPDKDYKRDVELPTSFPSVPHSQLSFADAGPLLLLSEKSLEDLNRRLEERTGETVPMSRFRPNIVVAGCDEPYEEDTWLLIQIGAVPFMSYRKATRCKMTGIDQESGDVDKIGPLEILREYRAPRGPGKAEFGQLLVPLTTGGTVSVGDPVKVLDRKKAT